MKPVLLNIKDGVPLNLKQTSAAKLQSKSYWLIPLLTNGALTFSPPTFSPSENLTHMVGPSDNWSAVLLVLVTNSPSPKPKVDELFVHPKNEHLYTKI